MYTYQDFIAETDTIEAITTTITKHINSDEYKVARDADEYDHQKNITINNYVRLIFSLAGAPVEDFTASNNKIASNYFHRLNTQRCTYLLGNGVSFSDHKEEVRNEDGQITTVDITKEFLGPKFDTDLKSAGYNALIHGVRFG